MSSIARDRIRRCLAMIPLIRARPGIRIPELASIFGVHEKEIWEDITEVLTMCGVPPYLPHNYFVFSIKGDQVSIRFAEHLSRPVHLTLQEALAIDLALRSVSGGRPPAFGEAAPRLRAKLRALLGGKERAALEALDKSVAGRGPSDRVTETIRLLKEAMSRNERVEIEYYTASRDSVGTRVIAPYGLIDHRGNWYVIASDQAREGQIPFRVERIRHARVRPGDEYEVPDGFTIEDFRRDEMWTQAPTDVEVKVRFSPAAAARVREDSERRTLREQADGSVVRTFRISENRPRWLFTHLARFGADAEIVSPASVRREMKSFLAELLEAYGGPVDVPEPSTRSRRTATAAASPRPGKARTKRRPRK